MSAYHLRFLPRHLAERSRWDELCEVLLDPAYLESRASLPGLAGQEGWVELSNAFSTLAANIDDSRLRRLVRLYDDTLRSHTWFLGKHPRSLFQVFWNALWWHNAPGTQRHFEPASTSRSKLGGSAREEPLISSRMERWRSVEGRA